MNFTNHLFNEAVSLSYLNDASINAAPFSLCIYYSTYFAQAQSTIGGFDFLPEHIYVLNKNSIYIVDKSLFPAIILTGLAV